MIKEMIQGIRHFLNKEVVPNTVTNFGSETLLDWLGFSKESQEKESTYFTCLKVNSESIAKMPIKVYRSSQVGSIKEMTKGRIPYLLKTRPNPYMTPSIFWNAVEQNRLHYGNAYVYIEREFKRQKYGGVCEVKHLWIMPSSNVTIWIDDKGYFGEENGIYYEYHDRYSSKKYIFRNDDVMHFKTSYTIDGITGIPAISALRGMIDGSFNSQKYMNSLYKNGLTAKAVVEYTGELSNKNQRAIQKMVEQLGSGVSNSGKAIPIPVGMKLVPLDIKLTDAQFYELKKYTSLQIAAALGVKPNQINDYTKSSYSNSEMQNISYVVDTLLFPLKQYEEEMRYKLYTDEEIEKGFYIKFNEKVLLRTDSKSQIQVLKDAINNSIYTPNEARRMLDMTDDPSGNELIANGTMRPLRKALEDDSEVIETPLEETEVQEEIEVNENGDPVDDLTKGGGSDDDEEHEEKED